MNTKPGKIPKPPNKASLTQKAKYEIITFIFVVACLAFFCFTLIIAKDILDICKTIKGCEEEKKKTQMIKILTLLPLVTITGLMHYALWRIVIVPDLSNARTKRTRSLVGPVTIHPIIPFPQDQLPRFRYSKKYKFKNLVPEARIHLGSKPAEERNVVLTDPSFISVIDEMNCWMEWIFNLDLKGKSDIIVPNNTRIISIKMDGFKHGRKSHDFEPIDGRSPSSYFTYQMFGENKIQVTNYVANGVSYIAGFCIYIENPSGSALGYDSEVIEKLMDCEKYPGRSGSREVETQTDPVENQAEATEDSEDGLNSLVVELEEILKNYMGTDDEPIHFEEPEVDEENEEINPEVRPEEDSEFNGEKSQEPESANSEEAPEDNPTSSENEDEDKEVQTNPEGLSEEDFDMLTDLKEEGDSFVGYCSKLQEEVECGFFSGKVIHRQWNEREKRMRIAECSVCLENYHK